MRLTVLHLTLPRPKDEYSKSKSLSEQLAKRRLLREGYRVCRGYMLDCFFDRTGFDFSINTHLIRRRLVSHLGLKRFLRIAKYCTRNHGTPDFLAVNGDRILGVEVKLGHERIASHQLETMKKLQKWGLHCEVWRYMPAKNKVREKQIDLSSWSNTGSLRASTKKTSYDTGIKSFRT